MYYEEKVINGILCWRGDPKGEWHEMDYVELLSNYESTKRNYYEYALLAQELKESRDAWKKVAEELVTMVDTSACCGMRALGFPEHNTDCPIEQLRKMKEREGC